MSEPIPVMHYVDNNMRFRISKLPYTEFQLWWSDESGNEYEEVHATLADVLARAAVLAYCAESEGESQPTETDSFCSHVNNFFFEATTPQANVPVTIRWVEEDVQQLRPNWSIYKCRGALEYVGKYLKDRSIETGWEILESLLDSQFLSDGTLDDKHETDERERARVARGY